MIEFIKRRYEELYDLPTFYLGIDEGWKAHMFCALFLLLMAIAIWWFIRQAKEWRKNRIEQKKILRNIEKSILENYNQKLNEKNENIR